MHTINNNRLVNNHSIGRVGEIEKGKKFAKRGNVALTQSQACDVYILTPNPEINCQTTKKESYASIVASKPFQALENL